MKEFLLDLTTPYAVWPYFLSATVNLGLVLWLLTFPLDALGVVLIGLNLGAGVYGFVLGEQWLTRNREDRRLREIRREHWRM